jgi:glycosyltransferase involved in cell wall biosynthesis
VNRPRVLIIAEACNPEWVSVPLVGWSHARALKEVADAHVVTQVRNREALLRAGWREGVDFTAIDSEAVAAHVYRMATKLRGGATTGWTIDMALSGVSYPYFEQLVWGRFQNRLRRGEFDLVHRITPLSPTLPSRLASWCRGIGVPFVLGPLNGGVPWPKGFDNARRREREWLSYVRGIHKLWPGYLSTRRDSSAILIASQATWQQMPRSIHQKCIYLPENAIDPARFARRRSHTAQRPIRAIFIGRLVPYKGADMLIQAAAPLVRAGLLKVDIIGDGPQMAQLQAMLRASTIPITRRGPQSPPLTASIRDSLSDGVTLAGWVEHARVQDWLAKSDVLAFPSIREFGGGVALEAMAAGVVPIVPNYGGLGELVTDLTGYLISMGSREQIIERLAGVLKHVVEHPEEIDRKSSLALRRAYGQFTWQAKAQQTLLVYDWVLGRRTEKPWFGMPFADVVDVANPSGATGVSATH